MTKTKNQKARITQTVLKSLPKRETDWFIRDTIQKGFQVKIPPRGQAVYQVEARLGGTGRVKKFKIGNVEDVDLPRARHKAAVALGKIRQGVDPLQEKRASLHEGKTLQELLNDYVVMRRLKPRTEVQYRYLMKRCCKSWLNTRITDISKHEIRDWYIKNEYGPVQMDNAYRVLNSLMRAAVALEIIDVNPCYLVANSRIRYSVPRRTRHVEVNHDLSKFLKAFIDYDYRRDSQRVGRDVMILILTTGLRAEEAKSLKWSNVDWERKRFTIPDTKNGRDHVVPLVPLTYAMLRYRQEHDEGVDHVFRVKGKVKAEYITSFQKTLAGICEKAGIELVSAHDLRRTFATALNSIGVGYADEKLLMNHKEKDVTAGVYIQPDMDKLRKILVRLVDFYDLKIPFFEASQGASPYARGVLRLSLYGRGDVTPDLLAQEEQEDWLRVMEEDFWEG